MLWLDTWTTGNSVKHPSQMYWKFGNKTKEVSSYDKEKMEKVSVSPFGKEYTIVWVGWCFSWFDAMNNKPIYSTEVAYNALTSKEMEVYTYANDKRVVLFKWVYDKNTTKAMLKDKWANLYLNVHYIEWDHLETLQFKGLNCQSIMDALRNCDCDNFKLSLDGSTTEKYKVISYEAIKCSKGTALTDKEKEEVKSLASQLEAYYNRDNADKSDVTVKDIVDELPF